MNQTSTKTAYHFCKNLLYELADRFIYVMKDKRAEAYLSDLPPFKIAEVVIGGTTYLVSSFFKKNAKGSVVDKISRMIERDADFTTEQEKVTNTTGISSRLEV